MSMRIVRATTYDVRFPTSRSGAGSDAMNPDPDYSAAYVALETDDPAGLTGHGLTFTIGRGTEVCVAAIEALRPRRRRDRRGVVLDLGGLWRRLVTDTQLRWLGPEKGVIHLATAAVVNAVWDLYAKLEGKPLWKLLADMTPEQIVACVDFRYIEDAFTPDEALELLRRQPATRRERERELLAEGFPAYTTSAGWLGYAEDTLAELAARRSPPGFTHLKLKVGGDLDDDLRRARVVREAIGPDACSRSTRIRPGAWSRRSLASRRWPRSTRAGSRSRRARTTCSATSAIREAVAPMRVATGEHVQNRVVFKQLLAAGSDRRLPARLLPARRRERGARRAAAGREVRRAGLPARRRRRAVRVRAARVDVRLRRRGRHRWKTGSCEFVDHLHEHFVDPVQVVDGRYLAPTAPGYSIEIRPESLAEYAFPDGAVWWQSKVLRDVSLEQLTWNRQDRAVWDAGR